MSKEKQEAERLIELFAGRVTYLYEAKACAAILCKEIIDALDYANSPEGRILTIRYTKVLEHIKQL